MRYFPFLIMLVVIITGCEKFAINNNADTFFYASIDEASIPVWVRGNTTSGKFLIYINGGPGLTSIDVARADMFGWSGTLEEDIAVVYYDQRGCGNAQGNFDESTLTLAQYVKDLDMIVDIISQNYKESEIYLMGHSFGGFIGTSYLLAENNQEKIAGWICVDGAHTFDYDITWQFRREFLEEVVTEQLVNSSSLHWEAAQTWLIANEEITESDQKNQWRDFIGWPGGVIIPEELAEISVREYLQIGFNSSYNPIPAYLSKNLEIVNNALNKDVEGQNLIEEVSKITLPTLFLWGKYDDLIPLAEGFEVFGNLGTKSTDRYFIEFEHSSHEPYISDPDLFGQEIKLFLEKH